MNSGTAKQLRRFFRDNREQVLLTLRNRYGSATEMMTEKTLFRALKKYSKELRRGSLTPKTFKRTTKEIKRMKENV